MIRTLVVCNFRVQLVDALQDVFGNGIIWRCAAVFAIYCATADYSTVISRDNVGPTIAGYKIELRLALSL
jgi:hypothetical protein